jgi:xanthosine utilization system XapX-like protein
VPEGLLVGNAALLELVTYLEPIACIGTLLVVAYRRQIRKFPFLVAFLCVRVLSIAILMPLIHLSAGKISVKLAYDIYFYVYWASYLIEAVLGFGIIFSLYKLAMAPLPGLQRLGMLMFRWAACIALALATATAFGPHASSTHLVMKFVMQLQQTQSILTLCMLLFVCLASRPMGLSFGSKIFGVSLGVGVLATSDLVASAWLSQPDMVSIFNVVNGISICATLGIWIGYLAVPDAKRRMIVLPTTSPFLRWNQISIALGDAPGFVTVGDFTPDMLAPAEVEVMRRASMKMRQVANV